MTPSRQVEKETGCPLFYVPHIGGGFLLAMEQGRVASDAAARRRAATERLGFEESDDAPGVATLGNLTAKDILFVIDVSGSMKRAGAGLSRVESATNNALKVFDTFTTDDDHVGLIWFNSRVNRKVLKNNQCVPRKQDMLRKQASPFGSRLRGAWRPGARARAA